MAGLKDIHAALKTLVSTLSTAQGHVITVPSTKVYDIFTPAIRNRTQDSDYPKVFVMPESGTLEARVSGSSDREDMFRLVFVLKEGAGGITGVHAKVLQLVDDVETLIRDQSGLNGLADDVVFKGYSTDGGAVYPEAIVMFLVGVQWRR